MAILARVLMLLACLPLLQPPGVCVCKTAGPDRTLPSPERTAHAKSRPAPKKGCCSRPDDSAFAVQCGTPEPSASHPCPPPSDDHHLPGCPASAGVDRFKWVEPARTFAEALPPVEFYSFLPVQTAAAVSRPISPSVNRPPSSPLYLSQCSLVI